ncbi:MAG: cupin domain-containing protein [Chloroflexota bacterium]
MEHARPILVRSDEGAIPPGPPTPGMDRRQLLDHEDRWVGWVRTAAGLAGGWHHHGARDSYIYVLRGQVTIDYGPGGRGQMTAVAGDFIFNPARVVHREITAADEPAEMFVVRVGTGPQNVNVDGPDPDPESR